jgi:arsenate reductase-like glutaredoxin family protein
LLARGAKLEERDLAKAPMSVGELDALIGERDYRVFLNPKNEMYRKLRMKEHPPARRKALELMAKNPNLIRRPIAIRGGRMVVGYDEAALVNLAS